MIDPYAPRVSFWGRFLALLLLIVLAGEAVYVALAGLRPGALTARAYGELLGRALAPFLITWLIVGIVRLGTGARRRGDARLVWPLATGVFVTAVLVALSGVAERAGREFSVAGCDFSVQFPRAFERQDHPGAGGTVYVAGLYRERSLLIAACLQSPFIPESADDVRSLARAAMTSRSLQAPDELAVTETDDGWVVRGEQRQVIEGDAAIAQFQAHVLRRDALPPGRNAASIMVLIAASAGPPLVVPEAPDFFASVRRFP
jgi:hypothetical protein